MSLETWKAEFYPCEADSKEAQKDPILHSLRKWYGLRWENLFRHGLMLRGRLLVSEQASTLTYDECLEIDGDTCALCRRFHQLFCCDDPDLGVCPLRTVSGGNNCDYDEHQPWSVFCNTGNPEPMIAALRMALDMHRREQEGGLWE